MKPEIHAALSVECRKLVRTEKLLLATENQMRQFVEDGIHPIVVERGEEYISLLREIVAREKEALAKDVKEEPVGEWLRQTKGLGMAVVLLLGLLPPLTEFPNPAKLWKYLGLDVRNGGRAPKRERGTFAGFNGFLRAVVIARIGLPLVRCTASPYRALYDTRKAHTLLTHPDMLEPGECPACDEARGETGRKRAGSRQTRERTALAFDCAHFGGPHWSPGHRHADAVRFMCKAVIVDMWRVENGMDAKIRARLRLIPEKDLPVSEHFNAGAKIELTPSIPLPSYVESEVEDHGSFDAHRAAVSTSSSTDDGRWTLDAHTFLAIIAG